MSTLSSSLRRNICTIAMAMAALKANKHIYLEKPIGHTIEEGAEIVKLSEKTNRVVQVGTQNRSNKLTSTPRKWWRTA